MGKKDLNKKLKQITESSSNTNHTNSDEIMDVFDAGAIIIFISAEDDSIGSVLNANSMFY